MFNKKASLEISIQAIVIVVLAMTLLGLGLSFIRGMFKNIGSTTEDVSEQVRQRVLDDLVQSDKKVSFPKTEVVINRGESTVLTVGIRNRKDTDLIYKMKFILISPAASDFADRQTQDLITNFVNNFQYKKDESTLSAADSEVRNIRLTIPTGMPQTSYYVVFKIEEKVPGPASAYQTYAEKDFFVVVRG